MSRIMQTLCLALLLLNPSGILQAQEKQFEDYKSYQQAYNLILDEQWPEAQKAIKKFIQNFPNSDWKDDAQFWFCYTIEKRDRLPEAAACYKRFLEENKDSKWYQNAQTNLIKVASQLPQKQKKKYDELLEPLHQNTNEELAITALYALQDTNDERIKEQSLNLIQRAISPQVRASAIQIISRFEFDEQIITTLKRLVREDESNHVRHQAMIALMQKTNQILRTNPSPEIRKQALMLLNPHSSTTDTSIFPNIIYHDLDTQRQILSLISTLPKKEGMDHLIKVIQTHPDLPIKKEACKHLAQMDLQKGLVFAQNIAQTHEDVDMYLFVIDILTRLPDGKGIPQLIDIAQSHTMKHVRQRAIQNLSYHNRDPRVRQALFDLTNTQ